MGYWGGHKTQELILHYNVYFMSIVSSVVNFVQSYIDISKWNIAVVIGGIVLKFCTIGPASNNLNLKKIGHSRLLRGKLALSMFRALNCVTAQTFAGTHI